MIVIGILFFVFCGCQGARNSDPVVPMEDSDVEMNLAIEKARNTFQHFVDNWQTMPNDGVNIKFGLPTTDQSVEHIWFQPVEISDTEITGICGNHPAAVAGLSLGDLRAFQRSELSDWMILVGDKCYGGYTIRVLAKMEPHNAPPLTFVDF